MSAQALLSNIKSRRHRTLIFHLADGREVSGTVEQVWPTAVLLRDRRDQLHVVVLSEVACWEEAEDAALACPP